MNELTYMKECAAAAARVARGAGSANWDAATPCEDYDLRTLVNHWVLYTSHGLERRARREQLPEEMAGRDFTASDTWADEYAAQLDRAVAAWSDPSVWEGEIDLGFASMPARTVAAMVTKEMAVHGWDVARATGQDFSVSPEVGEYLLGVVEEHAEVYRKYDGFAEPVTVDGSASAFTRALAVSGRDPEWRRPVRPARDGRAA